MAHFNPEYHKLDDAEVRVTVYRDPSGGWFLGREGDDQAYAPIPMGAFISARAAQRWGDRHFPGGSWRPA